MRRLTDAKMETWSCLMGSIEPLSFSTAKWKPMITHWETGTSPVTQLPLQPSLRQQMTSRRAPFLYRVVHIQNPKLPQSAENYSVTTLMMGLSNQWESTLLMALTRIPSTSAKSWRMWMNLIAMKEGPWKNYYKREAKTSLYSTLRTEEVDAEE